MSKTTHFEVEITRPTVKGPWRKLDLANAADEWLLHGPFVNYAQRHPDATAVVCDGQALTYGELLARVEELARHLRGVGVNNGDLIGVCTERSLDMLVAVYGILLAGGAYVPFDPSYPADRLQFMLASDLGRAAAANFPGRANAARG
jgi:non-ribosomal peptide synthetase component F